MKMKEKVVSMEEAVKLVPNGARLAIGGGAIHAHPMAFLRELIRQGKKDLTIVGSLNGLDIDILAGAHALARVETSYVGLERYGLARNFRRGVEQQEFEMVDYSDYLAFNRFLASSLNLTFWPCSYLGGSDIPTYNPDIKEFDCPITGRKLYAVPPANPDVAIIHAAAADPYGNVLMPPNRVFTQGDDILFAKSCETVIVTVERIVTNEMVRKNNQLNLLAKHRVTCVVEAPYGAHPCSMPQFYNVDDKHFREYMEAAQTAGTFAGYIEKYVLQPKDQYEYLEMIGVRELCALNLPTFI